LSLFVGTNEPSQGSTTLASPLASSLLLDKALPHYLQYRQREAEAHGQDLITATREEQLIDLRHPVLTQSLTRRERKETEQQLIETFRDDYPTLQRRLAV
jgi:hypothetical protein